MRCVLLMTARRPHLQMSDHQWELMFGGSNPRRATASTVCRRKRYWPFYRFTVVATAIVGVGLPSDQRLAVLLPLVADAGAGVSSFAIAILVIPHTASDTPYAVGFLVSSVVGATVVGLTPRRLVGRVRDG